jgi:hypothetical protein
MQQSLAMSNQLEGGKLAASNLKCGAFKRGLSLLATGEPGIYIIGDRSTSLRLHTRAEVTLAQELARLAASESFKGEEQNVARAIAHWGGDQNLAAQIFARITSAGLTSQSQPLPALPRRYGVIPTARDVAMQLILKRSAPELAECEWAMRDDDGGATTLALRSSARIVISGRSRVATLLLRLLPASGVGTVESADRFDKPEISEMDIGIADIAIKDIGSNFYQHQSAHSASSALFSATQSQSQSQSQVAPSKSLEAERPTLFQQPNLIIHCGDLGVEDQIDWMVAAIPHLIITSPIAGEVAISPIVLPGISPCIRCMELYELDRYGFSRFNRIPLTHLEESSVVASHFIASVVASLALNFIDARSLETSTVKADGVGEITYVDRLNLRAPQVVAINRHPLCGCSIGFAPNT